MSTFELPSRAALHLHDGRSLARVLALLFRPDSPDTTTFGGATFLEQEPGLVAEAARVPDHMRII